MRRRFRRQMNMPSFKDPVALRRENIARSGSHRAVIDMRSREALVRWPERPHTTLPIRATVERTPIELMDERTVAMLADVITSSLKIRDYEAIIAVATLLATERRMRRAFGPPYEEYEDDPILR